MVNVLVWVLVGLVGLTVFLYFNQKYLYKNTIKNHTPMMTKRFAKHPNGEISTIDYYYTNDNQKLLWKFHEWEQEIHAEFTEDIIVQPGAWDGNAFFIFRFNRNGSEISYPAGDDARRYFAYFDENKKDLQIKNMERLAKRDLDKVVSDSMDEDFAESHYGMEKRFFDLFSKGGGGGMGLPRIPKSALRKEGDAGGTEAGEK